MSSERAELVDSAVGADASVAPVWQEWGRITNFVESARLAFAREQHLWTSLEIRDLEDVRLSSSNGNGTYRVALAKHLEAIRDEDILLGSVLVHSYALAESSAAQRLDMDARDFRGIEDWGARLLATTQSSGESLRDGRAGAVEVAVVRNAYAHGERHISPTALDRLHRAGGSLAGQGSAVSLDYPTLKVFRGRLRDLMDVGGVGKAA